MSLKRQTAWSIVPMVTITAVSFFSLPLLVRYLGEEMYTLSGYISTFAGQFGFADLGLGVVVGRYIGVALGKGDQRAVHGYWGTGNLIGLPIMGLMGLIFAVLGFLFGPKWFNVSPENAWLLQACMVIGGMSLFLNFYAQFWNILLQAHLDFKFASQLRVVTNVVQMIPSVIIAWATHSVLWISLWAVCVSAAQLAIMIGYARRRYGLGFDFHEARKKIAAEMMPYTLKTFASLVAGSVAGGIDRMLLGRLAPGVDFLRYYICTNVGTRVQGVGSSVMGPVFHNTSRAVGGTQKSKAAAIYDEMFSFMFGWCLLAVIWSAIWHPIGLRVWLDYISGKNISSLVAPLFTPVIAAFSFNALGSVSSAQLGPFDRAGVGLGFTIVSGVLTALGVYFGWQLGGMIGVAYGFLASRVICVIQDFYVMRLAGARGWLSGRLWLGAAAQVAVGGVFALGYLVLPPNSLWLLIPAGVHGGLITMWLLRKPLVRAAAGMGFKWAAVK